MLNKAKRLFALFLAAVMAFGVLSTSVYAAFDPNAGTDKNLLIKTRILRNFSTETSAPDWRETDKVVAGEAVKARVYLDTDYFTSGGELIFFYDSGFFSDGFGANANAAVVNPYYQRAENGGVTGRYYGAASSSCAAIMTDMEDNGAVPDGFWASHNCAYITYAFGQHVTNKKFDGSQWLFEFDLTVKNDAPASPTTGDFFTTLDATASTSRQNGVVNSVPKGPENEIGQTASMWIWDANVTFDSDPVVLYTNYVTATFEPNDDAANRANFTRVSYSGEAGEPTTAPTPARTNHDFAGWSVNGTLLSEAPTVLPDADTTYVATWTPRQSGSGDAVTYRTEIYRLDPVSGEWIFTERVKRGDPVKARLYINTNYFTTSGDILLFYDADFFNDGIPAEGNDRDLTVNSDAIASPGADYDAVTASGTYRKLAQNNYLFTDAEKGLITNGYVDANFVSEHECYAGGYLFSPNKARKLAYSGACPSGPHFLEFDLTVDANADGWGHFFVQDTTIQNPATAKYGYVNAPWEANADDPYLDNEAMFYHPVTATVEQVPVTVNSKITLKGNGGTFPNDGNVAQVELTGYIGDPVGPVPAVEKPGSNLLGWVREGSALVPENIVELPSEFPFDDETYVAVWAKQVDLTFIFNNGAPDLTLEDLSAGEPADLTLIPDDPEKEGCRFVCWNASYPVGTSYPQGTVPLPTDAADVPVYPDEDTTYTAVFEKLTYPLEYWFLLNGTPVNSPIGGTFLYDAVIPRLPDGYAPPAGYAVSPDSYTNAYLRTPDVKFAEGTRMPAAAYRLYCDLVAIEYPATFYVDDEQYHEEQCAYMSVIPEPDDPVKDGYTFSGWAPQVGVMDSTSGKRFDATWTANTVTVTYKVDGEVYASFTESFGAPLDAPDDPYKDGYNFLGWAYENDPTTVVALPATVPSADTTFVAVFDTEHPIEYALTFDPNAGAFPGTPSNPDPVTVTAAFGTEFELPANPERAGYVFEGWSENDSAPAPLVDFGTPPVMGSNNLLDENTGKTYYAVWTLQNDNTYYVDTYVQNNDGTWPATPTTTAALQGTTGTAISTVPTVTEGFALVPDSDVPAENEYLPIRSVLSGVIGEDGNTRLSVYLAREKYDITFDPAGGKFDDDSTAPKTEVKYFREPVTAPADPTRDGYDFDGWTPSVASPADGDATYTAQWKIHSHEIIFDLNNPSAIVSEVKDVGDSITPPAPAWAGHTFAGWYKIAFNVAPGDPNYPSYIELDPDTHDPVPATIPATMPDEDLRYIAEWTVDGNVTYRAKFYKEYNAETTAPSAVPDYTVSGITWGSYIPKPAAVPEKTGYTFLGWSKDGANVLPDAPGDSGSLAEIMTEDEDAARFYAVWEKREDLSYRTEYYEQNVDGTWPAVPTDQTTVTGTAEDPVEIGDHVTAAIPAKTGFTVDYEHTGFVNSIQITGVADNDVMKIYYSRNKYNFITNVDGAATTTQVYYGAPIAVPDAPDAIEGYPSPTGWHDAPNGGGNVVTSFDPPTMPANDIELWYDRGDPAKHSVTYNVTYSGNTVPELYVPVYENVAYGDDVPVPTDPDPDAYGYAGYTFTGWFDEHDHTPQYYNGAGGMIDGDLVFEAQFVESGELIPYTTEVYLEKADGDGYELYATYTSYGVLNQHVNYNDSPIVFPADQYPAGSIALVTGDPSALTGTILTGTPVVLKAYYDRTRYSLSLDFALDPSVTTTTEFKYGQTVPQTDAAIGIEASVPDAAHSKTGYTFMRWIDVESDETASVPATMPNKNVSLKAEWSAQAADFTVTFDAGDGVFSPADPDAPDAHTWTESIRYGVAIDPRKPNNPGRDGYTFVGWAQTPGGAPLSSLGNMPANDLTFYAIWEQIEYTLIFMDYHEPDELPDAATIPDGQPRRNPIKQTNAYELQRVTPVHYGDEITFPADPGQMDAAHYEFVGWSDTPIDDASTVTDGYYGGDYAQMVAAPGEVQIIAPDAQTKTYYAIYRRVTVLLIPKNSVCTTQIERDEVISNKDNVVTTYVDWDETKEWCVYGLKEYLTTDDFVNDYAAVLGDGHMTVTPVPKMAASGYAGTGAVVDVYDNVTGLKVESFRIIIFGDVDGDSKINAVDESRMGKEANNATTWSKREYPADTPNPDFEYWTFRAADVSPNGRVNAMDINFVRDHHLGKKSLDQVSGTQSA